MDVVTVTVANPQMFPSLTVIITSLLAATAALEWLPPDGLTHPNRFLLVGNGTAFHFGNDESLAVSVRRSYAITAESPVCFLVEPCANDTSIRVLNEALVVCAVAACKPKSAAPFLLQAANVLLNRQM